MKCQQCEHENRTGRKFCANCGTELSIICEECDFVNHPEENFCGGCGIQIVIPENGRNKTKSDNNLDKLKATVPEELRQVTILFVDIADYTRISSEKEPEEIHYILSRFFELTDGIVQSYGGRIDKHIGDAVMGVFGAPVAHDNDPERAVRAAIEIRDSMEDLSSEIGIDLKVHTGIASGQVVASGLGSTAHQEYTVTGNSVNLAARLVEMANSNETLISDSVNYSVHKIIESENIGNVTVKGLSNPVKVWRLIKILDTETKVERRLMVGRIAELRQFQVILEMCAETESGHVLYVRGEAGIGKTRLIEEYINIANSQGFECHTGLVLDFGVGKGQDVIRAVVRSLLELKPECDLKEREQAVKSVISNEFLTKDKKVFLNDLLDVPQDPHLHAVYDAMDNDTRKRGKREAVALLMQNMSLKRPLTVVIEDIHWADQETLAYFAPLYITASNYPIILVMTSRLEGDPLELIRRNTSRSIKLTTIDLGPLQQEESMQFANEFFDINSSFVQDCVARSEGNPLFLEQLLLNTKDNKSQDVPGSVQSIVLARIDHLVAYDKLALQASSILGQRFSLDILRFLIDNADYNPDELIEHYLIRPLEGEYIFAHALVWESVYSSLLNVRKKELHEKAANWFSKKDPLLYAGHLERAGNSSAARAYLEAAKSQMQLFHFEPAIQSIDRGIAIASDSDDVYNLYMLRGECLREIGRPSESITEFRKAVEASHKDVDKCRAWIGLAAGMRLTDNYNEALSLLDDAEEVANSSNLNFEISQIHYYRGNLYFPLGKIDGCLEQHGLALESAKRARSPECEARAMSGLGDAYYSQGRMVTSLNHFRQCIDLCRTHGFGRIEVENRSMISWTRLYLNEINESLTDGLEAIKASVQAGQQRPEITARLTTVRTLYTMGDFDEAKKHIEEGLKLVDRLGANRFNPFYNIFLARIRFNTYGFEKEAVDIMKSSLDICKDTGMGFIGPWVLSTIALVTEDKKSSLAALDEGEEILRSGCVGHNYFDFYRDAMEVACRYSDWASIERYADALEDFISAEPLPWAEHYIHWGRALAAHGKNPSDETAGQLLQIKEKSDYMNIFTGVPVLEELLNGY